MKQPLIFIILFSLMSTTATYSQTPGREGKATVIFYRSTLLGGAYSYKLMQGDSTLTRIKYKSFYVVKLNPGTYKYSAKNIGGKDDLTLNLKRGQTYFVKCGTKFNIPVHKPDMILLTDEQAKKEANKVYLKRMLSENNLKI